MISSEEFDSYMDVLDLRSSSVIKYANDLRDEKRERAKIISEELEKEIKNYPENKYRSEYIRGLQNGIKIVKYILGDTNGLKDYRKEN